MSCVIHLKVYWIEICGIGAVNLTGLFSGETDSLEGAVTEYLFGAHCVLDFVGYAHWREKQLFDLWNEVKAIIALSSPWEVILNHTLC